jgi:predicted nucleic acid-binding protein
MEVEPYGSEPMSRVRAEIEIDQELLRWADEQASRSGRSRDEVLEEAVRRGRQPGRSLVDVASHVWERSDLTGQQAMALARAETEAARAERILTDRVGSRAGCGGRGGHQRARVCAADPKWRPRRDPRSGRRRRPGPRGSPTRIAELEEVLTRERYRAWVSVEQVEAYLAAIRDRAELVPDPGDVTRVSSDPDDDRLVALARAAGVDALVSGDEDLTSLELGDLDILTPRQVLDRLR